MTWQYLTEEDTHAETSEEKERCNEENEEEVEIGRKEGREIQTDIVSAW